MDFARENQVHHVVGQALGSSKEGVPCGVPMSLLLFSINHLPTSTGGSFVTVAGMIMVSVEPLLTRLTTLAEQSDALLDSVESNNAALVVWGKRSPMLEVLLSIDCVFWDFRPSFSLYIFWLNISSGEGAD